MAAHIHSHKELRLLLVPLSAFMLTQIFAQICAHEIENPLPTLFRLYTPAHLDVVKNITHTPWLTQAKDVG